MRASRRCGFFGNERMRVVCTNSMAVVRTGYERNDMRASLVPDTPISNISRCWSFATSCSKNPCQSTKTTYIIPFVMRQHNKNEKAVEATQFEQIRVPSDAMLSHPSSVSRSTSGTKSLARLASLTNQQSVADVLTKALAISLNKTTTCACASATVAFKTKFHLKDEHLDVRAAEAIQYWLESAKGLKRIKLETTSIDKKDSIKIQKLLSNGVCGNRSTLDSLTLTNAGINDDFVTAMNLSTWTNLKILNLAENDLTDAALEEIMSFLLCPSCNLDSVDLSRNRFSERAIGRVGEQLRHMRLRELKLEDHQHLLPLSTFAAFTRSMRHNMYLECLTIGNETMKGSAVNTKSNDCEQWQDDFIDMLNCFWQEPEFLEVTRQIRFLLQLNASGRRRVYEDMSLEALSNFMHKMPQLDGCFYILVSQPDLLVSMRA